MIVDQKLHSPVLAATATGSGNVPGLAGGPALSVVGWGTGPVHDFCFFTCQACLESRRGLMPLNRKSQVGHSGPLEEVEVGWEIAGSIPKR